MTRVIKWIVIPGLMILVALALGGCMEATKRAAGVEPVCTALIGPIKYNSTDVKSRRHAGADLSVDLHKRNQVGVNLGCKQYR